MVSKIRFKNFKIFRDWQTLEIKPITILIGKNNTGKTALLKLPTMIAGNLKKNDWSLLELETQSVRIGYSYEDLFYNRDPNAMPLVFEIYSNDNKIVEATFLGDINGNIKLKEIVSPTQPNDELQLNFDYIEINRKKPDYAIRKPYKNHKLVGINGENSYDIFYNSYSTDKDKILYNALSNWYSDNFEGWKVQINELSGTNINYEITLKSDSLKPINILNTGSGILQSFPLIVRSFMNETENTLIIIEEPESHLHPAAHGNLAQRFVESYLEDKNKKYLIETHSKNFILRLQAMIADPDSNFSENDIAIYYVDFDEHKQESSLEKLEIGQDGEIDRLPEDIFRESYKELLLLKQNQHKQSGSKIQN